MTPDDAQLDWLLRELDRATIDGQFDAEVFIANRRAECEDIITWAKEHHLLIQVFQNHWTTPRAARAWFAGGPVLPEDDAEALADKLRHLSDEIKGMVSDG